MEMAGLCAEIPSVLMMLSVWLECRYPKPGATGVFAKKDDPAVTLFQNRMIDLFEDDP